MAQIGYSNKNGTRLEQAARGPETGRWISF